MNRGEKLKKLKHSCRVCLSQGKKMFFLDNPLNAKSTLSILEILEMIIYTKVKLNKNYPCVVCEDCLEFLNLAYDFRLKFEKSQIILQNFLNNCEKEESFLGDDVCESNSGNNGNSNKFPNNTIELEDNLESSIDCESNENVEIIYIKYTDIHEDLNLQQTETEGCGSGNTFENSSGATSTVWDKTEKKLRDTTKSLTRTPKRRGRKQSINVDKYIIERPDTYPVVNNSPDMNDELIQAASNLKYKCSACPKLYSTKTKLEKHEEGCKKLKRGATVQNLFNVKNTSVDQDSFLYDCDKCSQVCLSMEELDSHNTTAHDYPKIDVSLNLTVDGLSEIDKELFRSALLLKYHCDGCTKVYSSPQRLSRHKTVCRKSKRPRLK